MPRGRYEFIDDLLDDSGFMNENGSFYLSLKKDIKVAEDDEVGGTNERMMKLMM